MISVSPDGRELAELIGSSGQGERRLLGITGAPGAGKSTLASAIASATGAPCVPMDGFHLADIELSRRGTSSCKGAPETFDAWGYAALLARLRERPEHVVLAPTFDRNVLEQPIANAIPVPSEADLVVTEGTYLLLDEPPWRAVREQLDVVWHVRTASSRRVELLLARHVASGKTPARAHEWVRRVDEPNAALAEEAAERADVVLDLTAWRGHLPSLPVRSS